MVDHSPKGALTGVSSSSSKTALSADLGVPRFLDFEGEGAIDVTAMTTVIGGINNHLLPNSLTLGG